MILRPTIVPRAPAARPAPRPLRVAGPITRWRSINGAMRGAYRLQDTGLELYELYVGQDADPDPSGTPDATSATLPFTHALAAGHTYKLLVRRRNAYGLTSENIAATTIRVAGDASEDPQPPSAPTEVRLEAAAGGAVRLRAWYHATLDGEALQADTFVYWITSDGSDPDPDSDPATGTATMVIADGVARLDLATGAFADGLTIKAVVRTRRSGPPVVDSENTDVHSVTSETDGPDTPSNAGATLGTVAEVG